MTDGIGPERLDELFDGRTTAETDEERDLLRLAAELRAAAPPAPDRLRERVAGLGEPDPGPAPARRVRWTPRWRFAAPAIAGIVAVVIAAVVIPRDGGSRDDSASASTTTLLESAPQESVPVPPPAADATSMPEAGRAADSSSKSPVPTRTTTPGQTVVEGVLRSGSLDDAHDAVQRLIGAAGGVMTRQAGDADSRTITVDLSHADRPALVGALTALDGVGFDDTALRAALGDADVVVIRIRIEG